MSQSFTSALSKQKSTSSPYESKRCWLSSIQCKYLPNCFSACQLPRHCSFPGQIQHPLPFPFYRFSSSVVQPRSILSFVSTFPFLPRLSVNSACFAHFPVFLGALRQTMPILMAMEALTPEPFAFAFYCQQLVLSRCSSAGWDATSSQ